MFKSLRILIYSFFFPSSKSLLQIHVSALNLGKGAAFGKSHRRDQKLEVIKSRAVTSGSGSVVYRKDIFSSNRGLLSSTTEAKGGKVVEIWKPTPVFSRFMSTVGFRDGCGQGGSLSIFQPTPKAAGALSEDGRDQRGGSRLN